MRDFGFATEQEVRTELGERLLKHRLAQGFSQADLALRCGVSVKTMAAMEKKGQATLQTFIRAVIGLGLVDEMQALFIPRLTSIAQMERAEVKRQRAPRRKREPDGT